MALLLYALEGGGVDNITAAVVPYPLAGPDAEPGSPPQGSELQGNEPQDNETQRNEPAEDAGAGNEPA
jgi:hypothetical protein